jgi:hypothetical protein
MAAPSLSPLSFGSLEHTLVFVPLVAVPLALVLLSTLLSRGLYGVAQRMQPVAAFMVLASFSVAKGALAAGLTVGWLITAVTVAISGVRGLRQGARWNASLVAAHLFLPVGALWLFLSRLGVGPRSFSALTVLLAAVHFHFSGFTLQILIAATGRALKDGTSRFSGLHRFVSVGAIAGIPLIAAGNALPSPVLKFVGVASMVLSVLGLAATMVVVARASPSRLGRGMLRVAAASVAGGMIIAGIYGAGELLGAGWIGVARMVQVHGLVNALGFTFCGLSGSLLMRSPQAHVSALSAT